METKLKKLITAHWKYIEQLLKTHKENDETIKKIKFHYKTAFKHGYKHANDDKHIGLHYD
uniref:Uncharacterized protein n=1 Tax=viral metagenome TaxID=1070528 RepID=A0A6H2A4X9_9ZZZZ